VSACRQQVGDEAPVAALPGSLRAHEGRRGIGERLGEGVLPVLTSHSGRVGPEGRLANAAEAFLARLGAPHPTELDRVYVCHPGPGEGLGQRGPFELRIATRGREATHVDERLDPGFAEDFDEFL